MRTPEATCDAHLFIDYLECVFSEIQAVVSMHLPRDSQTYEALKARFTATVGGEEPEVEVVLV